MGTIKPGLKANIIVADGPLFDADTKLVEHWVSGKPTIMLDRDAVDISGEYDISFSGYGDELKHISVTEGWKAEQVINDTTKKKVSISLDNRTVVLGFDSETGPLRLTGNVWMESRIWGGCGLRCQMVLGLRGAR